jgi:hypothetical protein
MSKTSDLEVTPISIKSFTCKQSKHGTVPNLPLRGVILAPSGSGKTVLLANLSLKVYRGCFEQMYVCGHSVNVDQTWDAVKKYQGDVMGRLIPRRCITIIITLRSREYVRHTLKSYFTYAKTEALAPLVCVGHR